MSRSHQGLGEYAEVLLCLEGGLTHGDQERVTVYTTNRSF